MENYLVKITNWEKALNHAKADSAVGIRIAPLTEDIYFGMYVTEILPSKKVGAHYHQEGIEVYSILSGYGILHTALPDHQNDPIDIRSKPVKAGDFFNIHPGVIHQLANTGNEPLILVFGCPASHLSSDRILTEDLIY
jgi:mannose-6-phosphate isomerase-like protein (cupin superfamily)